jgi:hypothetical protein
MREETYISIRGRIVEVRKAAFLFETGTGPAARREWVPRSLIHGADDKALDGAFAGETRMVRIFAWKAAELGLLVTTSDAATADLFADDDHEND